MKNKIFLLILGLAFTTLSSGQEDKRIIIIETSMGTIEVLLYDNTPLHKANMIKLVEEGFYTKHLFHRVIKQFMIQGGDPHSVNADKGERLGTGGLDYTIPAEFNEENYHKRGALAAARMGDQFNPEKASSSCQFYIVQGQVFNEATLKSFEERGLHAPFSEEQIKDYTSIGGTPHLDGAYTVFGEVISGLDVVDAISMVETDPYDRPAEDIIFSIRMK